MASDDIMTPLSSVHSSMNELLDDVDGYLPHDFTDDDADTRRHHVYEEEEDEGLVQEEGDDVVHMGITQLSRLSLETREGDADANTHLSDHADDCNGSGAFDCDDDDDDDRGGVTWGSTPGTPTRCTPRRRAAGSTKEYASESEAARGRHGARARRKSCGVARERSSSSSYNYRRWGKTRERQLDRAWEMKQCHCVGGDGGAPDSTQSGGSSPCVVVRTTGPGAGCMWMDMEEVKACRDLGLELPCDWTVEIPPNALSALVAAEPSSCGNSPVGSWRTSNPGEDPGEMKARLRVWAQAVALASVSRLSS